MRIAVLVLLAGLVAAAQDPLSAEKERVLGDHLAADLRREMPTLENAALGEYVQAVVQRLGVAGYNFEVLDSSRKPDVTEPMPLPGGRILLPSALFLAVQDEAEFAAMLAHAAAHLDTGHAKPRLIPGAAGAIPLMFPGSVHQDSRGRGVLLLPNAFRLTQDEREREADAKAVEMLTRTGYDASALHAYLSRATVTAPRLAPLPTRAADDSTVTTSAFTRAQDAARALHPLPATSARRGPPTLRRAPVRQ